MEAERARRLVSTAYWVAFIMAAVALADVLGRVLPPRFGDTTWRLGTVGIATLSLPTLLLALLIASLTAWYLQHRLVLRGLAVLGMTGAVLLLAAVPFFALDLLELRSVVAPEARASFHVAMGRAGLTVLAAAAAAAWIAVAAWRAGRTSRSEVRSKAAPAPLIRQRVEGTAQSAES
jgi:hypothetical protein